mgnify:CR=1 FL=1
MKSTKDSLLEDIKAEFAEVNAMMEALEAKEPEDEKPMISGLRSVSSSPLSQNHS